MRKHIDYVNEKIVSSALVIVFLVVGGVYGYSLALLDTADSMSRASVASGVTKRVLGKAASPYYTNPFELTDAKDVKFPVAQLRGCRNWEECANYCDEEENYQACVAWSKSLE